MFTSDFIKNYNEESDTEYLLEKDVQYPKELASSHKDFPFLSERRYKSLKKFKHEVPKEIEKVHKRVYKLFDVTHGPENKLLATVQDKNRYVVTISTSKKSSKTYIKVRKSL